MDGTFFLNTVIKLIQFIVSTNVVCNVLLKIAMFKILQKILKKMFNIQNVSLNLKKHIF